jgi:O-methyltransferase
MDTIKSYKELAQHLIQNKITMLWEELFDMPVRNFEKISSIEGDIVECGVWRGGASIFLSLLFKDKKVWCCDSYEGFQPLNESTYKFEGERHTPSFTHGAKGPLAISLEEVKSHFSKYGLENEDRIKFLKGFVNQTLPTAPIDKISILRIDVDSYSATLEVLDHLYSKVQPGGFIIFDDANLRESFQAIKDFMIRENLPLELHNPYTDEIYKIDGGKVVNSDSGFHPISFYTIIPLCWIKNLT